MNIFKIEYMYFDGDLINYVLFIWNFEICLEDDVDNFRNL